MVTLPTRSPTGKRAVQFVGGENMFRIAELYLGDATQWWRIAMLNDFPGEQPDFILDTSDATRLNGTLQIPTKNNNPVWP